MRDAVKRFLEVNNYYANDTVRVKAAFPGLRYSSGLRPGSKACSEHMNDWQHLSLRDLEPGRGGGREETRSGTKKRCSHNLQSGHPAMAYICGQK